MLALSYLPLVTTQFKPSVGNTVQIELWKYSSNQALETQFKPSDENTVQTEYWKHSVNRVMEV